MRKILVLLFIIIGFYSNAQTREKLQGVWIIRKADSSSKQTNEIEFQFKKNGDWVIMRSKGRLNASSSKSSVNIFESNTSFSFMSKANGQYYTLSYHYNFPSDDVLVLTNNNNVADVMTLDRKK